MAESLQTNSDGFVSAKPVTGWATQQLDPLLILLAIEALQLRQGQHTGYSSIVEFELTEELCRELAGTLTRCGWDMA